MSTEAKTTNNTMNKATWRDYFDLCKPKVVALLLLTSVVGVVLASPPGEISRQTVPRRQKPGTD